MVQPRYDMPASSTLGTRAGQAERLDPVAGVRLERRATARRSAAPRKSGPWTRRRLRSTCARRSPAEHCATPRPASRAGDVGRGRAACARATHGAELVGGDGRDRSASAGGAPRRRPPTAPGACRLRSLSARDPRRAPPSAAACAAAVGVDACCHTLTNRCTAVNGVSTSITQSTAIEQPFEQQAEAERDRCARPAP